MRGETTPGLQGLWDLVGCGDGYPQKQTKPERDSSSVPGPWSPGGERGPCLRPQPPGGVSGGVTSLQPGFVALGTAGG